MFCLVALNLIVAASAPEVFFSGQRVLLSPVADPVVVRTANHAAVATRLPGAKLTRMLGQFTVIEGEPSAAGRLVRNHEADEVLAVYEAPNGERLYADRHVRVRFTSDATSGAAHALIARVGGSAPEVRNSERNEYDVLAATAEGSLELAAVLRQTPGVLWAHPDFIVHARLAAVPNDPLFASSYHHEILNSAAAWDLSRGSAPSIVAILDSGTDLTHPDLANKSVSPRDTLDRDGDPTPSRDDAHGTACSGIATALSENGIGIAGMCPQCSLMPIRMLDQDGFTRQGGAAEAITWAVTHGARTISCSWSLSPVPDSLTDAILSADNAGAVILFASGNDGAILQDGDIAANPHVRAIGATDQYDVVASYSNVGAQLFLTAPSPNVVTDIVGPRGYTSGDYYTSFAGTSGSTPVVAGLAGLILSLRPELTNTQVADILSSTADKVGAMAYASGRNDHYGFGRANAYRALLVASNMTPCVPSPEDCTNGVDDDCDALIDNLDPQCAPADVPLGAACTRDFQCSLRGFCLGADIGYPSGYCVPNTACAGTGGQGCQSGTICVGEGYATSSQCHLACEDDSACRAGYWCRDFGAAGRACVPNCEVSPCLAGETCDATTKVCVHDGPSAVGGACTTRLDCADNGRCLVDDGGYHGGLCVTECQDTGACADGAQCVMITGGTGFCMPTCAIKDDCRPDFYACHPIESNGTTTGFCFTSCLNDEDCAGETCNAFGLCGDERPPGAPPPPPASNDDDDDDGGCAAVGTSSLASLVAAALIGRRRSKR